MKSLAFALLIAASSFGQVINPVQMRTAVESFPGSTLAAKIVAAEAAFLGQPVTLVINKPATLTTAVALSANHSLSLNAPIVVNASIALGGNNQVSCTPAAQITTGSSVGAPFTSANVSNISISDCTATSTSPGSSNLISSTGGSGIRVLTNVLSGMGTGYFSGTSNIFISGNIGDGVNAAGGYGVVALGNSSHVAVIGNHFKNYRVAWEVFNADVDPNHGGPNTRSAILALGGWYTFTGNTCENTGACTFYSGAHDISDTGNVANGCGDVCYDYEGVVDAVSSANVAKNCTNGCATTFFFSQNVHIDGGDFSSITGQNLVSIFNVSQVASQNTGLFITNNRLHCESVTCRAIGGDATDNPTITGNIITDGYIAWGLNASGGVYRNNRLTYTMTNTHAPLVPGAFAGSPVYVDDNIVRTLVTQTSTLPAVSFTAADCNSNVVFTASRNVTFGFGTDYQWGGTGCNVFGARVSLNDNYMLANNVVHNGTSLYDQLNEYRRFFWSLDSWNLKNIGAISVSQCTSPHVPVFDTNTGIATGCSTTP